MASDPAPTLEAAPTTGGAAAGPAAAPSDAAIAVQDLRKRYPGAPVEAVAGIDFSVARGEIFGLLGPNGAGKTTTIGVITTRVAPTGGQVLVDGLDVVADAVAVKLRLAVVPQRSNLDRALSALENLTFHASYFGFGRRERRDRALELMARVGLEGRENDRVDQYSGGMAQRLMIARALMHRPQILILDEPTTGLDPQSRLWLWDTLRSLRSQGTTLVLTTHDMAEADELCDRIAIVDHGKVIALDTPRGLRRLLPSQDGVEVVVELPDDGGGDDDGVASDAVGGAGEVGGSGPSGGPKPGAADVVEPDDHPATDPRSAPVVAAVASITGVERVVAAPPVEDRVTLRVFGDADAVDLATALRAGGFGLVELRRLEGSLEDVFVHLTGREMR